MTPDGQDPVELRIADAVEPTLFVDEADLGEIVVRTSHRAESLADGRTRVTYRMEITGLARRRSGPRSDRRSAATSASTGGPPGRARRRRARVSPPGGSSGGRGGGVVRRAAGRRRAPAGGCTARRNR